VFVAEVKGITDDNKGRSGGCTSSKAGSNGKLRPLGMLCSIF
jgi:hypothetical protein